MSIDSVSFVSLQIENIWVWCLILIKCLVSRDFYTVMFCVSFLKLSLSELFGLVFKVVLCAQTCSILVRVSFQFTGHTDIFLRFVLPRPKSASHWCSWMLFEVRLTSGGVLDISTYLHHFVHMSSLYHLCAEWVCVDFFSGLRFVCVCVNMCVKPCNANKSDRQRCSTSIVMCFSSGSFAINKLHSSRKCKFVN